MADFIEKPRHLCPLGGALAAITALPGAIPVLHAAPGCAGNYVWTQSGGCGLQIGGYCSGLCAPSTNVLETEIVFGGTERLRKQLRNTVKVIKGEIFFVITGCVTEIIGDDVGSVVNEFREEGIEVVFAETGGFHGNSYWGYDLVLQTLFRDVVEHGVEVSGKRVNIWGIPPSLDVFWRGNLAGVRSLAESLGLEVNTFFTTDDSLDGLRKAASASLNIVVSDAYGVTAARVFEEIHGTPFITLPPPIGPKASGGFLRTVGEKLGIPKKKIEAAVEAGNRYYYGHLETMTDSWSDMDLQRYAVIVGDANYAPSLTRFLADDLGWLPEVAAVTDPVREEFREAVEARFRRFDSGVSPSFVFEPDTSRIIEHVNRRWPQSQGQRYYDAMTPAFVLGSSLDRELAQSLGAGHLSVSFPVANRAVLDRGYTGYSGGLRLVEDIVSAIVAGR